MRSGKVRYIGSSAFPASRLVEAQWGLARALERFVTEQPPYSMLVRGVEADALPTCQRHGIGVISWSPSPAAGCRADGATAPHRPGHAASSSSAHSSLDASSATTRPVQLTSASSMPLTRSRRWRPRQGMLLIEVAIALVINHPAVTAAIIGLRTMEHLESHLPAADIILDHALLECIDEIVARRTNVKPDDSGYANLPRR